jgi:hypothetical protein
LSRKAIHKGIQEIETGVTWEGRIRRPGAGRKPITQSDPKLVDRLEAMIAMAHHANSRNVGRHL